MKFLRLKNLGSPTRWDAVDYFIYRDSKLSGLPSGLLNMVSDDRYRLDSDGTFWYAQLAGIEVNGDELKLTFHSDSGKRMYEFSYFGVKKVLSEFNYVRHMPAMIVQELMVLNRNGYRHAFADMTGRHLVIYAGSMHFSDLSIQ